IEREAFNYRTLAVVYVAALIIGSAYVPGMVAAVSPWRTLKFPYRLMAAGFLAVYLAGAAVWVWRAHFDGVGYLSRAWQQSETIRKLRLLPPDIRIYSNTHHAVYFLTGKPACSIPWKYRPGTNVPEPQYRSEIVEMRALLSEHRAVVA